MNLPANEDEWRTVRASLEERGFHVFPRLLEPGECESLVAAYDSDRYRSTVVMARHGYGRGEYKYYRYPLPPLVADVRPRLYERLVPIANDWQEALDSPIRFPIDMRIFSNGAGPLARPGRRR